MKKAIVRGLDVVERRRLELRYYGRLLALIVYPRSKSGLQSNCNLTYYITIK